jgi:hypothetical protein
MSRAANAGDDDGAGRDLPLPSEIDDDGRANMNYLERNTRSVDFRAARDSESWERAREAAKKQAGGYEHVRDDLFVVQVGDGEPHFLRLYRTIAPDRIDGYYGACSCEAWEYGNDYCAHLAALGQTDATAGIVPLEDDDEDDEDDDPVESDDAGAGDEQGGGTTVTGPEPADGAEPDVVDGESTTEVSEQSSESENSVAESKAIETVEPQGSEGENPVADTSMTAKTVDPALERTPDEGVLDLAPQWAQSPVQGRGGDMDLNKDGCQFVAAALGIDTDREFLERAESTGFEYATVECTAVLEDRSVTRTAMAHIDESNVAKTDINRMAETRAYKRAVKSISGGGLAVFASEQ